MSETQRKLFNRRAISLLIFGALALLLIVFVVRVPSPSPPEPIKVSPLPEHKRVPLPTPKVFDAEAFKKTIIDNNMFRPLGWTPPHPKEPYRLLGTMISRDANIPRQAILQATATNTTHIVTTGEKLNPDIKVVDILQKHITLETNGQQQSISLNTATWLR